MSSGMSGLGSLAQSARQKQLKSARGILLGIGILTVLANLVYMALAESQVKAELDKEVQQLSQKGMAVDRAKLAKIQNDAVTMTLMINGVTCGLGVVFILFGIFVNKYPVPITIAGLVLYIGAAAVFAFINPESLIQGIIIKVIIVAALVKSLQAALAYEREKSTAAFDGVPAA